MSFGLVEIDWEVRPGPEIALRAIDADGKVAFDQRLSLGDRRLSRATISLLTTPYEYSTIGCRAKHHG